MINKTGGCILCAGELSMFRKEIYDTRFGIEGAFDIGMCNNCGLIQLKPHLASTELKNLYERYYNFGGEKGTFYTKAREYFFTSFLSKLWMAADGDIAFYTYSGNGRLLDFGCNEGRGAKVRQWCREQGIADKVIFVDHLGPEEVKQAYVDANVFVLPSYTENFGMTVVEAMACGCPVVISDQVNIWREIQEERAGLVVGLEPGNIANSICRVLLDKDEAGGMGRRGRVADKGVIAGRALWIR